MKEMNETFNECYIVTIVLYDFVNVPIGVFRAFMLFHIIAMESINTKTVIQILRSVRITHAGSYVCVQHRFALGGIFGELQPFF